MSDYIKREDAINAVADYLLEHRGTGTLNHIQDASVIINIRCPSADVVKRKRGEWLLTPYTDCGSPVYECSVCTHGVSGDLQVRNFCPNCGCRMKGADDE